MKEHVTPFPYAGRRASDPKHPVLGVLETYWRTLRLGTDAPDRDKIDPSAIDTALPWTFMLQSNGHGRARVRVAGQKIHDLMGLDPRGMMISSLFAAQDHEHLATMVQTSLDEPALVSLPLVADKRLLKPAVEATIMFLPLSDTSGHVTRILGALVGDSTARLKGRKLRIEASLPARVEPLAATTQFQVLNEKGPKVMKPPALRLVVNNG